jgi:X-X-X-Leu-X-X-Gly heptad repeat protein
MLSQIQKAMQHFKYAKQCFNDALAHVDFSKDPTMFFICQGLAALAEGLSELVSGLDQVQTAQNYTLNRIENSLNEVLNKIRQI